MKYDVDSNKFLRSSHHQSMQAKGNENKEMTDDYSYREEFSVFDHDTVTSLPYISDPKPNRVLHNVSRSTSYLKNQYSNNDIQKTRNVQKTSSKRKKNTCILLLEDVIETVTDTFCGLMRRRNDNNSNLDQNIDKETNHMIASPPIQKFKETEFNVEEEYNNQSEGKETADEDLDMLSRKMIQPTSVFSPTTAKQSNPILSPVRQLKYTELMVDDRQDLQSRKNENEYKRDFFIQDHPTIEDRNNEDLSNTCIRKKGKRSRRKSNDSKPRRTTTRTREVRGPLRSDSFRNKKFQKPNKLVTRVKLGIMGIDSFGKPMPLAAITPKERDLFRNKSNLNMIVE